MKIKNFYIFATLSLLIFFDTSLGLFYLPAVPAIGKSFNISPAFSKLLYPCVLFGSAISYMILGPLSDAKGTKKILCLQLALLAVSCFLCLISTNSYLFFVGIFLQGMASFYTVILRYIKHNLDNNIIKMLSIILILGTCFCPINTTLSGYLTAFNWRYIFLFWTISILICLILSSYLPVRERLTQNKFEWKIYKKNLIFFIKNNEFRRNLALYSMTFTVTSIFYTQSPHIVIENFGFSAKDYGLTLFIPMIGTIVGGIITPIISKKRGRKLCIRLSQSIMISALIAFLIIFPFAPSVWIMFAMITLFFLAVPLISTHAIADTLNINIGLSATGASFLTVGIKFIAGIVSVISISFSGEQMGISMLLVCMLGFFIANFFDKLPKA